MKHLVLYGIMRGTGELPASTAVGDGHDELEDLTIDWTRLGLDL